MIFNYESFFNAFSEFANEVEKETATLCEESKKTPIFSNGENSSRILFPSKIEHLRQNLTKLEHKTTDILSFKELIDSSEPLITNLEKAVVDFQKALNMYEVLFFINYI